MSAKKPRSPLTASPQQPRPSLSTTTTTTTPKPQRGDRRFPLFPQQQQEEERLAVSREFGRRLREQSRVEAALIGSEVGNWGWRLGRIRGKIVVRPWPGCACSVSGTRPEVGRAAATSSRKTYCLWRRAAPAASLPPCSLARRFGFGPGTDLSRPVQLTSRLCLHFLVK